VPLEPLRGVAPAGILSPADQPVGRA
jgi:hypothetical protein